MKKVMFTKAGLHAWGVFLVAVLCLMPCAATNAQTLIAQQLLFNTCEGTEVIVRQPSTGVPVMSYRHNGPTSAGVRFVFNYDPYTFASQFSIPDTILYNGYIEYHVNDMYLLNRRGYFCGTRIKRTTVFDNESGRPVETIDSVGVLGRFVMTSTGFGNPAHVYIKLLEETKSLEHMDGYVDSYDMLIAMTGVANLRSSASCMVVARYRDFYGTWAYSVWSPYDESETFTDVTINAKETVFASRRSGSNNMGDFYLRIANATSLIYDDCSELVYRYKLTPRSLLSSPPDQILEHSETADIRLCAVPWESYVHVAYPCYYPYNQSYLYCTALCRVSTNFSVQMDNLQVVEDWYSDEKQFLDMGYLYKTYYQEQDASVALLQSNSTYNTVVLYPNALNSAYGTPSQTLKQMLVDNIMHSVSIFNGNNVRLAGIWNSTSPKLTYLKQEKPNINDKDACMKNSKVDVWPVEGSQIVAGVGAPLSLVNASISDFLWGDVKYMTPDYIAKDTVCEKSKP